MRFTALISSASLALSHVAMAADEVHGSSELGNSMGPVDFLWPSSREWSADADNTAPCGSNKGPGDRTIFPISQGLVSLSIADAAYNVAFYIAVDDDPDAASDFQTQVVQDIAELDPGHQCYRLRNTPTVTAGTNATIQLQYWADYEGEKDNQKFYACADVTFVELSDFDIQAPCFNVTSEEFNPPASDSKPDADTETTSDKSSSGGGGLSKGATAGVAVGTIVGSLAIVGLVAWFMLRRRKAAHADAEAPATKSVDEVEEVSR
ncbi:related to WSC2 Glucoamylase III (alpha-1,4-glucan-glucosidase) [Cephalotrichum gorgonifer]|uniref:Related to WSC2 Glucoamylase III (Alpha-1,4-glucan-glucosidase) n=1 Tax=Cephalotrichum gorgonifer TaxID=2041049 RepID=A0AAE8N4W9_9PEZI|nr:related to WSC2 Glucoamylase III (alpha-1,4-glucan-glucosidase) [Cephalotrichum gorgonifer]